ncbi:px domain containing protein [Stylonychia lemnae]|uniref:Px domain containing protein n=1 Tax=Stylonychia lemnae TaxID=5949 RepID=A0A078A424_STYLE|nr:px domain containing protein [Stylonychia lemnae]|eukprot:CDW76278.1 px domain containing protein [Stylonychia lemnae]
MMNFIREALSDENKEQIIQGEYVKEQQLKHGARAFSFVTEYQKERLTKQGQINESVVSQGYEIEEFLAVLAKEKGLGPNVDFFSLDEIKALAQKFIASQMPSQDGFEENKGTDGRRQSTMSSFFENNMNNMSRGSISKKMSVRRPTNKIEGTILNRNKNIITMVQNCNQVIQNSMLQYISNSYINLEILTLPFKWKVKRTNQDFKALRDYLLRKYPQTIVPALPRFNPKKKLTGKQLIKKCIYYNRFLTCVLKSQILRSADFLVDFLREPSVDQFMLKALGTQQDAGPRKLAEFNTLGGQIEINGRKRAKAFCDNLDAFNDTYQEINNYISKKVKTIQGKSHDLADEFYAVGAEIQRFSSLLKPIEIPQVVLLYDRLANIILRNGDFILSSGEVLNTQLNGWFKYHREESTSFKEAQCLREEAKKVYDIRYEQLMKQKAKLFKKQDVLAWRVDREFQIDAEKVKTDPAQAYQYILPDTTKEIDQLREEAEYFTNQCYNEFRRVMMMDYDLARDNFVDMGEMMLRMIYQMNIGWQEFLSFYTNLNVVRKQFDEKFQEDKGIGEEIDDPNHSSSDDEYNQPLNEASLPPRNSNRLTHAYKDLLVNDEEKAERLLGDDNQLNNTDHAQEQTQYNEGGQKNQIEFEDDEERKSLENL